jgi:plastocyanin
MSRRATAVLGLVAAAGIAAVAVPSGSAKESFDLKGEVYGNTAFKIEMKNAAGRKLTRIKAGTYRIKIEDKATIHNFRLTGPGVNRATSTPRTTETVWRVRLKPGRYVFVCDPHASTMKGSFRVVK